MSQLPRIFSQGLVWKAVMLLAVSALTASTTSAAKGFVDGPMYYYSVTRAESTGWIYIIPFCKKMSAEDFKPMKKKCVSSSPAGRRCRTDKSVELKEAGGKSLRKFALDYFVFVSERECVQDRESYTSGDVVPFGPKTK